METGKVLKFQDISRTETAGPISFVIDWTIPNFSYLKNSGEMIRSKPCVIGESAWKLGLCPSLFSEETRCYPSVAYIVLVLSYSQPGNDELQYVVRIKNGSLGVVGADDQYITGQVKNIEEFTFTKDLKWAWYDGRSLTLKHHTFWAENVSTLQNDTLKLRARVTYLPLKFSVTDQVLLPAPEPLDSFRQAFKTLEETTTGRDFVLVASDGVEMSVHRAVLIARSPVFAAMFESNLKETQTGRCVMSDITGPVLADLIKYMYCGCSPDFRGDLKELFLAADKYQLPELFSHCEEPLIHKLSKDNAVEFLLFADGLAAPALKKAALRFMSAHVADMKKTGQIEKLVEGGSAELVTEVIKFLV